MVYEFVELMLFCCDGGGQPEAEINDYVRNYATQVFKCATASHDGTHIVFHEAASPTNFRTS